MKWKINRKNRRVQTLPHVCISVYIARGVLIYRRRLTPLWRSDPPRTSLKSRIAPQNCCKNNNQWKMLIQLCIRSTKVTAHEIGWTPTRNFGTIWFIRSLYWFFRTDPLCQSRSPPGNPARVLSYIVHIKIGNNSNGQFVNANIKAIASFDFTRDLSLSIYIYIYLRMHPLGNML